MIFAPRWLVDRLCTAGDAGYKIAVDAIRDGHKVALHAIGVENAVLRAKVAELTEQIRYERNRADALVDRLLVRDAKVYPVAPQAVEAGKTQEEAKARITSVLDQVFSEVNQTGEDDEGPMVATEVSFDGGGKTLDISSIPRIQ